MLLIQVLKTFVVLTSLLKVPPQWILEQGFLFRQHFILFLNKNHGIRCSGFDSTLCNSPLKPSFIQCLTLDSLLCFMRSSLKSVIRPTGTGSFSIYTWLSSFGRWFLEKNPVSYLRRSARKTCLSSNRNHKRRTLGKWLLAH